MTANDFSQLLQLLLKIACAFGLPGTIFVTVMALLFGCQQPSDAALMTDSVSTEMISAVKEAGLKMSIN